jgi:hypothetical protein
MFIQPLICPRCCCEPSIPKLSRHIPLLLQWDSVTLPLDEDPPINPLSHNNSFLAPRYYIKIYHPFLYNTDQSFSPNPITYKIDRYGLLTNKLQLALRPCVSNEEEALYRVEYYYWRKKVDNLFNSKSNITHTFIKSEYWYIPYKPLLLKALPLIRKDDDEGTANVDILPSNLAPEVFFIDSIINKENWGDWSLVYNQLKAPIQELTNERIISDIGIHWVKGPRPASKYTVNYYQPLTFKEVLRLPIDYPLTPNANPPYQVSTFNKY